MPILDHALRYASSGWPVFPCWPGEKSPLAEHVAGRPDQVQGAPHGFHDATTDQQLIHTWWSLWPNANLAWPTGPRTADVLDIDVRPSGTGWAALIKLKRHGLLPPPLAAVQTPSGGLHLYFPGTSQPSGSLPGHFLDFKAVGGYVLAPPSTINGHPYSWVSLGERPSSAPVDWAAIRRFLAPPPLPRKVNRAVTGRDVSALARVVAATAEGNRNRILFWAACRASAEGHDDLAELLAAAIHAGLPEPEARRTIANARRWVSRTRSPSTPMPGAARE